ncbi:retrovirus-related pol polyprotein from transposon TNT 1-94, partial [Tanacetum coccineum]
HKAKKGWIQELNTKHRVSFVAIQETKMKNIDLFSIKSLWGNFAFDYVFSPSVGYSGGILCAWDPNLFHKDNSTISDSTLWEFLGHMINTWDGQCVLLGDFDEVRSIKERHGTMFNVNGANAFNNFITMAGLVDLPLEGYSFTWSHKSASKMSKLDRFLISEELSTLFPSLSALCLDRHLSDHRPILMHELNLADLERDVTHEEIKKAVWDCGINKSPGPGGFTFEFFCRYWKIINNDVVAAVLQFFSSSILSSGCNSSFNALIPNTQEAEVVKDFRPISLIGPYKPTTVVVPAVAATDDSPEVPQQTHTMSPDNKAYFLAEKDAIFLLLTSIGDEIYLTVDACNTANKMLIAIKRLQQGESLNIQDVKTNLFWEFGKFTSHDGESMESYYSWFYKMMNEMTRNNLQVDKLQVNVQFLQQLQPEWSRFVTIVKQTEKLDEVTYHMYFNLLKQYQKEVNEIRTERIAKSANPLALVAAAQPYPNNNFPAQKTQRHKGKEVAKPVTPPSESDSDKDSDLEQAQRDKEMQKNLALIAKYFKKLYKPTNNNIRTSLNSRNKTIDTSPRYKNDNQYGQFKNQMTMTVARARETVGRQVMQKNGIQCFNCKEYGHFARECRKPKRVKDYMYHKEKMLLCKQAKKGIPLQAEQADWLEDMDEEIDEQELEAHYSFMANKQEVLLA